MDSVFRIAIGSLVVGFLVLGLKLAAYWVTGSVALLSDALESTVNVATAIAALIAVRFAATPADARHPYGHHKSEYVSAVIQGAMILVAALLILREAYAGFLAPRAITAAGPGLALNGLATVINGAWCWVLIRRGRALRSPALVADGWHLFSDVISSVGVAAGVALTAATGWAVLDPALAAAVALHILWAGWRVMREAVGGLMDEAVPPERLAEIRRIISSNADGAIEAHDLRTRHAGRATFIEFHLVVPSQLTVSAAHDICDRIEKALKAGEPDAVVTIHVEPEDKAKHEGIVVL